MWAEAERHLSQRDPALGAFIAAAGPCTLARRRHPGGAFAALARAIVFQQLAGRAAAAIHARFVALYAGRPTPAAVAATPLEALRGAGLSAAKAASIKDLAAAVLEGRVPLRRLAALADDEVVARLTTVRGIGPWTAHMFLIFTLTRPDVWPVTDLGVRAGFARLHALEALPSPAALDAAGEAYRPYRSIAAWYCWRVMDAGVSPPAAEW